MGQGKGRQMEENRPAWYKREFLRNFAKEGLLSGLAALVTIIAGVASNLAGLKALSVTNVHINPTYLVLASIPLGLVTLWLVGMGLYRIVKAKQASLEHEIRTREGELFQSINRDLSSLLQGEVPNAR